ncbi:MAG: hypothetical protein HOE90_03085 [Bacteriovoracaceae bacterium]|jgi:hypothetical protein|nr:hypothetical protein [Bacteriovoracaceae bacterium]
MGLRHSLWKNVIAIVIILLTVGYITYVYSPCPEGEFIHSANQLDKWCLAKSDSGELVKHGPWVSLYEDGGLRERGEYLNGLKDGHWVYWYKNGRKKLEGNLKAGKRDGRWSEWDIKGQKF